MWLCPFLLFFFSSFLSSFSLLGFAQRRHKYGITLLYLQPQVYYRSKIATHYPIGPKACRSKGGEERADQAAKRQLIGPQGQAQRRDLWLLPAEPGRRPLQHRSRDGSSESLAKKSSRANKLTGHRGTGVRTCSDWGISIPDLGIVIWSLSRM